jgi:hypothetical protein
VDKESAFLEAFIQQSYAIEGESFPYKVPERIFRAHEQFIYCEALSITSLVDFVSICAPDAAPRFVEGLNVYVGDHTAPPGGRQVHDKLAYILSSAHSDKRDPRIKAFDYYWRYLYLHPFTDFNGRSARAIWLSILGKRPGDGRLFLEEYHYQSLMWQDKNRAF